MIKTSEHQIGEFWAPNIKNKNLPGLIYIENCRIYLRVYGGPIPGTEYMKIDLNFHKPFPVVHGVCLEFNKVTLVNLKLSHCKSINGRSQFEYVANYLIIGREHLKNLNSRMINYSMLSFYRMNEFLNEKVIEWEEFFKKGVEAKIQIKSKEARLIFKDKWREDYIHHRLSVTQMFNPVNEFIKSRFFFNSKLKKKINFTEYVENLNRLQTFFSIASGKNKNIESAFFKIGDDDFEVISSDIIYNSELGQDKGRDMVIRIEEVEEMKNKPFEKWMLGFNTIEHSVFLYQNTLKEFKTLTTKNYFLNLFFSNESIMKVTIGQLPMIEKIPNNIVRIADKYGISGNDRESLFSRFKKENPTCLTYFEALQSRLPNVVKNIFGENYLSVIRKAKNTRDLYVHKNAETSKEVIVEEGELLAVASKLRVLFQANCLLHMGFEDGQIKKMLFRNPANSIH